VLNRPEYKGAAKSGFALRPGLLIRYRRVTLSSGAGFAARREDADRRGLGIDLKHSEELDVSLGLRVDNGRNESTSPALAGMGDVKRTLRLRIGADWRFAPGWQLAANWTVDAFNRGGGSVLDARIQYEWQVTPRIALTPSASVAVGGPRYMKTWFGVDEEQSARSGHPVYDPGMGLRELSFALGARGAPGGEPYLLSNEGAGPVKNLSFEREFGKIIGSLDLLSKIIADKTNRIVAKVFQNLASAIFLPVKF